MTTDFMKNGRIHARSMFSSTVLHVLEMIIDMKKYFLNN